MSKENVYTLKYTVKTKDNRYNRQTTTNSDTTTNNDKTFLVPITYNVSTNKNKTIYPLLSIRSRWVEIYDWNPVTPVKISSLIQFPQFPDKTKFNPVSVVAVPYSYTFFVLTEEGISLFKVDTGGKTISPLKQYYFGSVSNYNYSNR
jgi:hypothetical protein